MRNSSHLEDDIFKNSYLKQIDWYKTLHHIRNENKFSKKTTNEDDTRERGYKIKNFIKELPTYEVLCARGCDFINSDICPRCEIETESWNTYGLVHLILYRYMT